MGLRHTCVLRRSGVGIDGAVAVEVGGCFGCALLADGRTSCWPAVTGMLANRLDDAEVARRTEQVPALTGVVQLALHGDHTCARTRRGEVLCWGSNGNGQLGPLALGANDVREPVLVPLPPPG